MVKYFGNINMIFTINYQRYAFTGYYFIINYKFDMWKHKRLIIL